MAKFQNLPIRTKLFLSFGIMIFLIVFISMTAYMSVSTIQENNRRIHQIDLVNVMDALEIRAQMAESRDDVLTMIIDKNQSVISEKENEILQNKQENNAKIESLVTRNKDNADFSQKLAEFQKLRTQYSETRDNEQIPLIFAGKEDEAIAIALGIQSERFIKIGPMINDIVNTTDQYATDSIKKSDSLVALMNMIIMSAFIISIVVGFWLTIIITRSTSVPLNELAQKANQIAAGDLSIEIPPDTREDEIGMLNSSFKRMLAGLREVHKELSEGINVLASSSSEILTTTTQIASGATETAAAVSETTTTIEEVKQTSDLSSEKAKQVADEAQKAANVAQAGKKAVEEMVRSMQRVQEQMESIADNVVQLAEKSQEIGEIIVTVNDIAEQSNILAVNASIEAAMAGEEGRRFDVVAQEMRTLADQSKQATAQVRTILTDIQRGVSTAVMATEQGNRTVNESMKQSTEAGESIRILTGTINESATAAIQIAASSQQQTVGINQIMQSMENIKLASQQNLTGTKQAEETARILHDLGQKLRKIASRYRL